MEGATFAYLILAIINWLAQWAKYFIYFWFILGLKDIVSTVNAASASAASLSSASTVSGATDAFANLAQIGTDLLAKFTIMIPIGLFWGTMLNSALTFYPMVAYRGPGSLDPQFLGYYYSTCTAFFWTWAIIGWIPTVMFLLDGIIAQPLGSGVFGGWNTWLFIIEASLWFTTVLTLSLTKGALWAWFIKNHVKQAHEVLAKFDKTYKDPTATTKSTTLKDAEEEKEAKADGFDDDW